LTWPNHHPHHRLHGQHRSPRPVTPRRDGRFAKSRREVLWVLGVPVLYGISFDGRCHSRIITISHPIPDRRTTITWASHPPFSLSLPASLQQCTTTTTTTTTHPFRCQSAPLISRVCSHEFASAPSPSSPDHGNSAHYPDPVPCAQSLVQLESSRLQLRSTPR